MKSFRSVTAEWWVVESFESQHIHVVPVADLVAHEISEDCACLPCVEVILGPDDVVTDWYLVTHAAWDGRP